MLQELGGAYREHLQNTARLVQTTDCSKLPHRHEMWLIELDLMHYKLVSGKRVKPGSLERGEPGSTPVYYLNCNIVLPPIKGERLRLMEVFSRTPTSKEIEK